MAKRILPYRDYSEHDVVNLFSLDLSSATAATLAGMVSNGSGEFDAGVVVSVSAGALPGEVSELRAGTSDVLRGYLGASFSGAHIGFNGYPANTGMTVAPAAAGSRGLGITLRETLAFDENGEKLLYYKQKLDEAQGVLPGQTVPVLTRGLVLLAASAISGTPSIGDDLEVKAGGLLGTQSSGATVGSLIAIGEESDDSAAKKYLCRVSF